MSAAGEGWDKPPLTLYGKPVSGLQSGYQGPGQGYTKGIRKGIQRSPEGRLGHVRKGQNPDALRHTSVSFDEDTLKEIDDRAAGEGKSFAAMVRELVEVGLETLKMDNSRDWEDDAYCTREAMERAD
jgi:hypothetical protein